MSEGRGVLILVVGPSGAGKDTLIRAAKQHFAGCDRVVFPRRIASRPPDGDEDNIFIESQAHDRLDGDGAFALRWSAHGLSYAIPRGIEVDLAHGACVVCNVSRTVVAQARERYATHVVAVTAAPQILAERLALRRRASDGDLASRVRRSVEIAVSADVVIDNSGPPEVAVGHFVQEIGRVFEARNRS
jgi:ribose 1,5-bisphosphokinase